MTKQTESYAFDTYANDLVEAVLETVRENAEQVTAPISKFKLTYRSFEELLPSGVELYLAGGELVEGEDESDWEIAEPDTSIPAHFDFVAEEDTVLPNFLEAYEIVEDAISWGGIYQIPMSILRYEVITAARRAVDTLATEGIYFTSDCTICIGDGDEDETDAEAYLRRTEEELATKLPKEEKEKREAFAKCCYVTKEKQEWLCQL